MLGTTASSKRASTRACSARRSSVPMHARNAARLGTACRRGGFQAPVGRAVGGTVGGGGGGGLEVPHVRPALQPGGHLEKVNCSFKSLIWAPGQAPVVDVQPSAGAHAASWARGGRAGGRAGARGGRVKSLCAVCLGDFEELEVHLAQKLHTNNPRALPAHAPVRQRTAAARAAARGVPGRDARASAAFRPRSAPPAPLPPSSARSHPPFAGPRGRMVLLNGSKG